MVAKRSTCPLKKSAGTVVAAKKKPASEVAARKTPAHKTPANKTPAHKTPARKSPTKCRPAAKTAVRKTSKQATTPVVDVAVEDVDEIVVDKARDSVTARRKTVSKVQHKLDGSPVKVDPDDGAAIEKIAAQQAPWERAAQNNIEANAADTPDADEESDEFDDADAADDMSSVGRAERKPRKRTPADRLDDPPPETGLVLIDRITSTIERELLRIERMLGLSKVKDGKRSEAESRARTLASLARTLAEVRRIRAAEDKPSADDRVAPRDLDDFRRALSRRLEQMVGSAATVSAAGDE